MRDSDPHDGSGHEAPRQQGHRAATGAAAPTPEFIAARLGRRGAESAPRAQARGDHELNPGMAPRNPLVAAAVLLPIIAHSGGATLLFERRSMSLADHAGEICFPGGRLEAHDRSPEQAALRELEEELGLSGASVEIIGHLDPYETRTGFRVQPLVGVIRPPIALRLDPVEVAEAFEVPLAHVLDPANYALHRIMAGGIARTFRAVPFGGYFIWGATAGMLMNLCELMGEP